MSTEAQEKFLRELIAHGLLIECGVPGVYSRGIPTMRGRVSARAGVVLAAVTSVASARTRRFISLSSGCCVQRRRRVAKSRA